MKKVNIFIKLFLVIISFVIFVILVEVIGGRLTKDELFQRLSRYHNKGDITLTINNKKEKLNNIPIILTTDEQTEEQVMKDNKFSFKKGVYGYADINFKIPSKLLPDKKEINVILESDSSNWWYVVNYELKIELKYIADNIYSNVILDIWKYNNKEKCIRTTEEKILDDKREIRIIVDEMMF